MSHAAPKRRFSLTRVASAAPAPETVEKKDLPPPPFPKPVTVEGPLVPPKSLDEARAVLEPAPAPAAAGVETPDGEGETELVSEPPVSPRRIEALRSYGKNEDRHPKKKRSYSVDMGICDDLELIAWYRRRSSSSIVEELMKRYVAGHRDELEKARQVNGMRQP